jgi:ribonuclease HI
MSDDPRALKLYVDGNCYKNPGGPGAVACVAQFPEEWNRPDEIIFNEGFHETTNNRMELQACIGAYEYVAREGTKLGVERVLIVTDSLYVFENRNRAVTWRANKWLSSSGRPLENSDLWKRFLSVRSNARIRTEVIWRKGKKSPTLKMVDCAAKAAGKAPQRHDRGFRGGKVARSKLRGGSSFSYPARGQEAIIRIYRSGMIRKTGHKLTFDLYDESAAAFIQKYYAYSEAEIAGELHRQHCYRVRFNDNPKHPLILEIIEEIEAASLEIRTGRERPANN